MKTGKSEIVLIVDRSGSMSQIRTDMEGGFKEFLKNQKEVPGETYVTYYQFDDKFEKVFELNPLKYVDSISIQPRGWTALLDAIGKSVTEVGNRLSETDESDRPESVIVVIVTDGVENASREFTIDMIKEMIKHQEEKYNWKFVFLGANMDAVGVAGGYGFSANSTMTYSTDSNSISSTFDSLTRAVSSYRLGSDYSFTDEDRSKSKQT